MSFTLDCNHRDVIPKKLGGMALHYTNVQSGRTKIPGKYGRDFGPGDHNHQRYWSGPDILVRVADLR